MNTRTLQSYAKVMGKIVTKEADYKHLIFLDSGRIWASNGSTMVGLLTPSLETAPFVLEKPFTFLRTVRRFKCAEVALESDEDTLRLSTESYTLALASKDRDAPEPPEMEEGLSLSLHASEWLMLLTSVSGALCKTLAGDYLHKPDLAHILIDYNEDDWQSHIVAAAADSFQLTTRTLLRGIGWGDVGQHFVPAVGFSAVLAFLRFCDEDSWVRLARSGRDIMWSVAAGHVLYQTEAEEEPKFPKWDVITPAHADGREFGVIIERKALLTVLSLLGAQKNIAILIPSETSLSLWGMRKHDRADKRTSATVSASQAESLPPTKIAVDIRYLTNAVKSAPNSHVIIQWPDPDTPLTVQTLDGRYLAIIMPVYSVDLAEEYRKDDEDPPIRDYVLEPPPELAPSPGNEATDGQ